MEEIIWEHPEYFWLGLLLVPAMLIFYLYHRWRNIQVKTLFNVGLDKKMMPLRSERKGILKFSLLAISFLLLLCSLANPRIGAGQQLSEKKGIDLMIALDVSNSMLAEDLQPNRLERSKQFLFKLLNLLGNDRVGLIVFAGNAYVQMPLTIDHSAARMFLKTVSPGMIPSQGTSISDAISLANQSFQKSKNQGRALLILSDGEDHEEGLEEQLLEAEKLKVKIFTLGVGSPQGAPIPTFQGNSKSYKKDKSNKIVLSKLNEKVLGEIAAKGNGNFFLLSGTRSPHNEVFKALESIEKGALGTSQYQDYQSFYQVPLFLAFLLLLIEFLTLERKSERLSTWLNKA